MSFVRTVDPTVEPVTAQLLGEHLRLPSATIDVEREYLETLIKSAREFIELRLGLAMNTQTWELALDTVPTERGKDEWWDGVREGAMVAQLPRDIKIDIKPLIAVTNITTYDNDDTGTVFASSNYYVDTRSNPARIVLREGAVWPVFTRTAHGLVITMTAGYGPLDTDVPAALRQAVMIVAADWYENRESVVIGTITATIENSIASIFDMYKVRRV